jgi:hypothetical protein
MTSRLDEALSLTALGFKVFPLHWVRSALDGRLVCTCGDPRCKTPGKHPLGALAPKGLTNATDREHIVRHWWGRAPLANIGMATGWATVLDVDPRHGGDASLQALEAEHGALPPTWRTLTGGGGEHIFFRPPEGQEIRNSAGDSGLALGLDVRGVGGYVVAPSSLHESGRTYEWSVDHHPYEVPLAPMPDWLVARLAQPAHKAAQPATEWRRLVCDGVSEGGRNRAITRLTGHLLRRNIDAGVAHELMQAWNAARCEPPLEPEEVTKTVASIARKELRRREARDGQRR